jgi:hypothetical protein
MFVISNKKTIPYGMDLKIAGESSQKMKQLFNAHDYFPL